MSAVRVLWGAAVLCLLGGIGLRLAPAAAPVPSAPPIPTAQPLAPALTLTSGEEVVTANMFGASRTPPAVRFTPRGVVTPPTAPAPAPLRLYGITVTGDGAIALIDADPRIRGAEIYRVGERVRSYRLMAINDSTVTLAPESGGRPLVLRLPPGVRRQR